jgi:hypothetical protein
MSEYTPKYTPPLDPMDLFAPTHANGPDTEREAARTIKPRLATLRRQVIALARSRGREGVTADECVEALAMEWQETSVRPRLSELCLSKHGCILTRTTRRRQNRRQNLEAVYVLTMAEVTLEPVA